MAATACSCGWCQRRQLVCLDRCGRRLGNFIAFRCPPVRNKFLEGLQGARGKGGNVVARKRAGLLQALQQLALDDGAGGQGIGFEREPRLGQAVAGRFGARNRLGLAQGDGQGVENDFAQGVVIVIGAEAQQPEDFFGKGRRVAENLKYRFDAPRRQVGVVGNFGNYADHLTPAE